LIQNNKSVTFNICILTVDLHMFICNSNCIIHDFRFSSSEDDDYYEEEDGESFNGEYENDPNSVTSNVEKVISKLFSTTTRAIVLPSPTTESKKKTY
jgi:hypothetical protein